MHGNIVSKINHHKTKTTRFWPPSWPIFGNLLKNYFSVCYRVRPAISVSKDKEYNGRIFNSQIITKLFYPTFWQSFWMYVKDLHSR